MSFALILVAALVASTGWTAAALFYGLWRGEQGRNADIRDFAALRLGPPPPAEVHVEPSPEDRAAEVMSQEARQKFIEDLMEEENIDPETARERVDAMLAAHARLGAEW